MKNPLKNFSPSAYVLMVAFVVVACAGIVRFKGGGFDPRVTFDDGEPTAEKAKTAASRGEVRDSSLGPSDISVRYADRLREASALALGLTTYVVHERLSPGKRVIPAVADLVGEFRKTDLVPPGIYALDVDRPTDYGLFESRLGLYYVRYRPSPLAVEVLAAGAHGLDDGAVFLVRLPEEAGLPPGVSGPATTAGGYATLFIAPFANATVPVAFSSASAYAAAGWRQEPLRAAPIPPEKLAALRAWLARSDSQQ